MRLAMSALGKFVRLPRAHKRVLARALLMTPKVSRSLKRDGYAKTTAWVGLVHPAGLDPAEASLLAKQTDTAIRRLPWDMKCLERSIVVRWVAGNDAKIRLGVSPGDGDRPHRFHAWVEQDGAVLNDPAWIVSEYLPLSSDRVDSADPSLFD